MIAQIPHHLGQLLSQTHVSTDRHHLQPTWSVSLPSSHAPEETAVPVAARLTCGGCPPEQTFRPSALPSRNPHHTDNTLVKVLHDSHRCPPGHPTWDPDARTAGAEGVSTHLTDTPNLSAHHQCLQGCFGPNQWANLIRSDATVQNDQARCTHTRAHSSGSDTHNSQSQPPPPNTQRCLNMLASLIHPSIHPSTHTDRWCARKCSGKCSRRKEGQASFVAFT